MRFDFYGRFALHVERQDNSWAVFRVINRRRQAVRDLIIPSTIREDEIERYLDDLLHEHATPGSRIRRLD